VKPVDRRPNRGSAGRICRSRGCVSQQVAARLVAQGQVSPVAFARQCPGSPLRLFLRHALDDDQTDTAFHLELVQRVLARFEFSFWFFDLATPFRTNADGNQEHGGLSLSFLFGWQPGHSGDSLAVLQCSGLGRFLALLCHRHFSAGHRHFAICSNDPSAAAHERDLDSPKSHLT
jgi:hypothetical protein